MVKTDQLPIDQTQNLTIIVISNIYQNVNRFFMLTFEHYKDNNKQITMVYQYFALTFMI